MFERFLKRKSIKNPKNGKWKEFNKQAILVSEGFYQHDLKHGLWKQYYETGELLIEETYDKGILHGRYASYHLNGQLLSEGEYQHGKREGFFNIFNEHGEQTKRLLFVNNVLLEEVEGVKAIGQKVAV
jgi:antitoxin component YwqK of YwqJK toxin-antitoxin module